MGSLTIQLTEEPIDTDYCGDDYFRKVVVLEDNLNANLQGIELRPAYHVSALGLTIDLTSTVCWADYILLGKVNKKEAKGYFNLAQPLGGHNIGRFTATPMVE